MASKSEFQADEFQAEPIQNGTALNKGAVLRSLDELRGFNANWNGYGAAPLDPQNLDAAQRFVDLLRDNTPTPKVVPMTRGRVQLEWHRGNRSLELEFENPTTIRYLQWDSDRGVEREDIVSADEADVLLGLLNWFTAE